MPTQKAVGMATLVGGAKDVQTKRKHPRPTTARVCKEGRFCQQVAIVSGTTRLADDSRQYLGPGSVRVKNRRRHGNVLPPGCQRTSFTMEPPGSAKPMSHGPGPPPCRLGPLRAYSVPAPTRIPLRFSASCFYRCNCHAGQGIDCAVIVASIYLHNDLRHFASELLLNPPSSCHGTSYKCVRKQW